MKPAKVGLSYKGQVVPQSQDLASAIGNPGVHVVSSPATIGYLEIACHHAIDDLLEPGDGTVGVEFQLRHVGAAFPERAVDVEAELIATDGKRLRFRVEASQDGKTIMQGEHVRALVSLERFLKDKAGSTAPSRFSGEPECLPMKTPDDLFTLTPADGPLILSVPHAGTLVPPDIARRLTPEARGLPDTDWYVDDLYDFATDIGATMIAANYSRYVIDLNRPPDGESLYPGQATTGLCPPIMFDGTPIYADGGEVSAGEVGERRAAYWQPYHDRLAAEIARAKARHGFALVYDCHSIASRVPRLFDGDLPVLNLGTARTTSCDAEIERQLAAVMAASGYTHVVNGRFIGGYITRKFGRPADGVHAVQMELGCDAYLAEGNGYRPGREKYARLKPVLRRICETFAAWRPQARAAM